jgi:hypothetical protein
LLTSEIIVWIFYLCWFIFLFLKSQSFFVIIVFAILLFVLYVVGVNKLGSRFLVLENIDGNMIHIPYHAITSSVFKKNETIDQKSGYTFELETKSAGTFEEIKSNIQKSILSLPWSSIHKSPVITLLDQTPEQYLLKITVFAIDKSFGSKIEDHIKKLYAVD